MVLLSIFHTIITFWESLILNQQLWRCFPPWPLFSHYDRKPNGRGPRWYSSSASPWCPFKGGPHWPWFPDWSVGAFFSPRWQGTIPCARLNFSRVWTKGCNTKSAPTPLCCSLHFLPGCIPVGWGLSLLGCRWFAKNWHCLTILDGSVPISPVAV